MAKTVSTRKRGQFVSAEQKKYLMDLLEVYPELQEPVQKLKNESLRKVWIEATLELNTLSGPQKSARKWRRTLHDLRYRAMKRMMQKKDEFITNHQSADCYDDHTTPKSESPVEEEFSHALLHGEDPNLSDTASWTDSTSKFENFASSEEPDIDENIHVCSYDSVEQEQMAIIACSYDDICVHADSVTPPSFLEEVIMTYELNLQCEINSR